MALNLGDVDALLDGGVTFTVRGKEYRIPPVRGDVGLWLQRLTLQRDQLRGEPSEEQEKEWAESLAAPPIPDGMTLEEALLSRELVAELGADGVDMGFIRNLAHMVHVRIMAGDQAALAFVASQGNPPGPANREERRAAAKTVKKASPKAASSSKTTSTAGASTSRRAVSGSGTSTRKAPAKKAAGSRGATS